MSRLITFSTSTELITEDCSTCHVLFAMPKTLQDQCRAYGNRFYCPNGHPMSYTKSEITSLRKQVEEAEKKMRAAKCEALNAQARVTEIEKAQAKTNRRIHAGVCPCCNRTFTNLARHMATKHPAKK